jgi:amino acid adenylation domain-containing protein
MVAVLEAGGAYVPLDPAAPPERMRHVVQETGATILLAPPGPDLAPGVRRVAIAPDGSGLEALPGPEIAVGGEAGDVAVVIYTSGSTGAPKGSAIPHRGIVRLVRATNYVSIGPGDRVAQVSTFAFDAATFEVWGALLNGACLVQIAKETVLSPPALAASLRDRRVDVILLTTSLFHHVAAELPQAFGCVRDLLVGGEALDPGRARQVLRGGAPPGRLVNLYGPTENSTVSTWHWVQDVPEGATSVPIGRPISNTRCHILDRQRRAVPIGAEGELYLAGDGLAYGYWNDPAQTAACFVPSLPGEDAEARLYRTGDRARFRADGVIEFLGRVDDQVKIRGFRIEPGEIEMVLRDHAAVDDAAVLVRTIAAEKRLVAYVKPKAGAQPSAADLRAHAARKVPDYMIPAEWVLSETLPLTLSGKLDRRALPQQVARGPVHREVTAPRNRTEARLVALWKELLGAERVGTDEDFFEVGGHSLLAVRLVAEIEKQFGHELPVATLVRAPTIVQLAAILQAATAPAPASQRVHVLRSEGTQPPLLCVGPFSSSAGEITALAFRGLSAALGADQPVYALQPPELIGARTRYTIATVAAELLHDLRTVQAHGPYHLVGYCIGATLALEMASQLRAAGEEVPALVLVDGNNTSACDGGPAPRRDPRATLAGLASYASRLARSDDGLARLWTSLREKGKAALQWGGFELWQRAGVPPHPLADGRDYLAQSLVSRHRPRPYPGDVVVVYGVGTREEYRLQADLGWSRVVSGRVTVHEVQGDHGTILRPPHVTAVAERVRECLDRARAPAGRRDRTTGRGA